MKPTLTSVGNQNKVSSKAAVVRYVITSEDIASSGANRAPDLLGLARRF